MDFLLTWSDGEEVKYKFFNLDQIQDIRFHADYYYSLTKLSYENSVEDITKFSK